MKLAVWGGVDFATLDPAPVQYWVTAGGVFRCQTTPVGAFRLPWPQEPPEPVEPDPTVVTPQVTLSVPRIPAHIRQRITALFRAVAPQERLLNIYWHSTSGLWEIETPPQVVTPSSVDSTGDRDPFHSERPRVLQIHSHGHFPAIFSATDDADELACGLYAVMGAFDQPEPTLAVRAGIAGQFLPLDPTTVFEEV